MKKVLIIALILVLSLTVLVACDNEKEPKHLDPVDGNSISYNGDLLSWGAVDHAECYWIYLNDSAEYYTATGNVLQINLSENVTFSILAVAANEDYISAETKGIASFRYVPQVETIGVERRVTEDSFDLFTWTPIAGADYYMIRENGSTTGTRYTPAENATKLTVPIGAAFQNGKGGQASLSILPCSNDSRTYSHWSTTKTVTVLAAPSNFSYNKETGMISWGKVENATSYKLCMDEQVALNTAVSEWPTTASQNAYVYRENVSTFKFFVKAIGDYENDILDSRKAYRSFEELKAVEGLQCNFGELRWNASSTADNYELRISTERADENDQPYTELLVNTIVNGTIYMGDLGQFIVGSDNITLTVAVRPVIISQEAEDRVTFSVWTTKTFDLLKAPTLVYRGGKKVAWDPIAGAVGGYYIKIDFNGVNIHTGETTDAIHEYEYDYDEAGTYEIRVMALGNNKDALSGVGSSPKSNSIFFDVLGAPSQYAVFSDSYNVSHGVTDIDTKKASDVFFYFNDVRGANKYSISSYDNNAMIDADGDSNPDSEGTNISSSTGLNFKTLNYTETVGEDRKKGDKTFSINTFEATALGFTRTVYISAQSDYSGKYVVFNEKTNQYDYVGDGNVSDTVVLNGIDSMPIVITKLASPEKITLSGNELRWDRVAKASGYMVKIVCTSDSTVETQFKQVFGNVYDINLTKAGAYDIYICSLGNDNVILNSIYSSPIHVVKLPAVTDLAVKVNDAGACSLVWTPKAFRYNGIDYSAKGYEVHIKTHVEYINEANAVLNSSLPLSNMIQYFSTSGSTCTVKALGQNTNVNGVVLLDSVECSSITIFKLARPTSVVANANALAWAQVMQADGYEVYNGDTLLGKTDSTAYAFTRQSLGISDPKDPRYNGGASFRFSVRATRKDYKRTDIANSYYVPSENSAMRAMSILPTPEVTVDKDTGEMSWAQIPQASSYLVKIGVVGKDDEYSYVVLNSGNVIKHTPTITAPEGSTLQISVTAIGDNVAYISSFDFSYKTVVEKLASVATDEKTGKAFTITVRNDKDGKATAFDISILDAEAEKPTLGRGYYINIGGVDVFTADGKYSVTSLKVGEYDIKVCAVGGNYSGVIKDQGDSNKVYINSDYSDTQTIYVLSAPADIYVSTGGLSDMTKRVVCFEEVPAAAGYKISYTYRTLVDSQELASEVEYDVLDGYPKTVTLNVGENTSTAYVDEEGKVNFVLGDITADVTNILIHITVLGDGVDSITSEIASLSYNVR